jgi:hypothetical protein
LQVACSFLVSPVLFWSLLAFFFTRCVDAFIALLHTFLETHSYFFIYSLYHLLRYSFSRCIIATRFPLESPVAGIHRFLPLQLVLWASLLLLAAVISVLVVPNSMSQDKLGPAFMPILHLGADLALVFLGSAILGWMPMWVPVVPTSTALDMLGLAIMPTLLLGADLASVIFRAAILVWMPMWVPVVRTLMSLDIFYLAIMPILPLVVDPVSVLLGAGYLASMPMLVDPSLTSLVMLGLALMPILPLGMQPFHLIPFLAVVPLVLVVWALMTLIVPVPLFRPMLVPPHILDTAILPILPFHVDVLSSISLGWFMVPAMTPILTQVMQVGASTPLGVEVLAWMTIVLGSLMIPLEILPAVVLLSKPIVLA